MPLPNAFPETPFSTVRIFIVRRGALCFRVVVRQLFAANALIQQFQGMMRPALLQKDLKRLCTALFKPSRW